MTTVVILILVILAIIVSYLAVQFNVLSPARKGLPVLMYHKIEAGKKDGLTVASDQFEAHLQFMKKKGYKSISFNNLKEMMQAGDPLPAKSVVLTFDDAYLNFKEEALPLLKKYGFTATVFAPVAYIGKTNIWDQGQDQIMSETDLRKLAFQEEVEIGIHSFQHGNYGRMPVEEMENDLRQCRELLEYHSIPYINVLAYPYGGYPKKNPLLKKQMIAMFERVKLDFALRIGNRINPWPLRFRYEIKRIDIRGTDSFFVFKTKLLKGHARMFA